MNLTYKGTCLAFTDQGSGTPLVLLHGFLENKTMWQPFIPTLSKNYRVIAIDLLGHGASGCLGYVHTIDAMAEAVESILKHLKINQAHFIGHSMGGYVVLAYAERNPNTVSGLCLMNSTSFADTEEKKINRDRAIQAVKQNYKTFIRLSINNLFMPKNRSVLSAAIEGVIAEAMKTPVQGIVAALEGMKLRPDRFEFFKQSTFKKKMIIGKYDPVLEAKLLIEQAQKAESNYVEFQGGHMSHLENKQELLKVITTFLNSI